ncbi:hypothetical protein PIB30_106585 [Stylosanthes scabra]|uniref:Putative plant transposon protein domain-containing protein n=1 Tax=Stylosanthes scabra TaxID=79078 RepID=A0ABU6RZU5_9FABA|nr:hypothetical protein [Stylosanthes scabra]
MASSSRTPKGRKGKQVMRDDEDDNHDPYRFFTNFHEKFFLSYVASKTIIPSTKFKLQKGQYRDVKRQILMRGWVKLGKPKKNISATLVREFYANARKNPDVEDSREFPTFVRGVSFGFSKERIRDVLELRGPLDSETSFNVRKLRSNRDTDAILRDICVEGAVWETGAHMNPLKLRLQDLTPLARGWHDFVIHNIKPTSNQSEVTVERAVLIHCIITSQEVEVEEIIEDTMANIISKFHLSKPPLAFPNIIARLLEDSGVDYHALDSGDKVPKGRPITAEVMENIRQPQRHSPPPHQTPQPHQFHEQPFPPSPQYQSQHQEEGEQPAFEATFEAAYEPQSYGWGQLQEDMANMKQVQMEFYESILAQNAEYAVRLQSIERRQSNLERGQELIHQEFANNVKDFSARMDQMHTELKAEKDMTTKMKDLVVGLSLDSRANDMYTHWGLQQCIPNYGPTNLEDIPQIPHKIRDNFIFSKPWHEGLIHPTQPGESSTTPP